MPSHSDSHTDHDLLQPLDGGAGPARELSEAELEAAVRTAVRHAFPPRRALLDRRRSSLLLAAAVLGVTGLSAALVLTRPPWAGFAVETAAPAPSPHVRQPVPETELPPSSVKTELPESIRSAPSGTEPPATEPRATEPPATEPPATAASNGPERSSAPGGAADLLKAANQLRRQGRWRDAERGYAEVAGRYRGSAQGAVAALAAASLRLEHLRDPRGALQLYEVASRSPSLSAEAGLGIADCHRALGNRNGEMAALQKLLSAHPKALFRERVKQRLEALESGRP